MKLVCPSCGAVHSTEAWFSNAAIKACFLIVRDLPKVVEEIVFNYLALFRPASGRSLQWSKTRRLLEEIRPLVTADHIQYDRKIARPCVPKMWAQGMERMVDSPPGHLPMKSHNYLKSIVYDLAYDAARQAEKKHNEAIRSGNVRSAERRGQSAEMKQMNAEELKAIRDRNFKKPNKEVDHDPVRKRDDI